MEYGPICSQILNVSLRVQPRHRIWISGWDHTTEFVAQLRRECEKRECWVVATVQSEVSWLQSIKRGPIAKLERLSPRQKATLDEIDSYIFTLGPRHPIDWGKIPTKRRHLATIWLLEQNQFAKEFRLKAAKRGIKMLGVEATLATRERAKALGLDFANYAESMYAGCIADSHQMLRMSNRVASALGKRTTCSITSPRGTALQFQLDDRQIEKSDGVVSEQEIWEGKPVLLPAGGVGTTVDEDSAEGTILYDRPIRTWKGIVERLKLNVRGGKVVGLSGTGEVEAIREFFEANPGDAGRFAFIGFGLNPLLKPGYTQDDKVLGSIELNFGENKSRGGRNRGAGNFWGTVSDASVTVGNSQIMKMGKVMA